MLSFVNQPSKKFAQLLGDIELIDVLKGGTPALRRKGEKYLPKFPSEAPDAYLRRLAQGCLAPYFSRLCSVPIGMLCKSPLTWSNLSSQIENHFDNVDLIGNDVDTFKFEVVTSAIEYGYCGILTEFPMSDSSEELNYRDWLRKGLRPYWVHYPATRILDLKYDVKVNFSESNRQTYENSLTQVRLLDWVIETQADNPALDEFEENSVQEVTVFDRYFQEEGRPDIVTVRKFREGPQGWGVVVGPLTISLGYIPFTLVQFADKPPLLEIAYLNIKHYQKTADLDHSLTISAHPTLCLYGYNSPTGTIAVGPNHPLLFDLGGKAEWLSANINSFEAQTARIREIETHMSTLGLAALTLQKNVAESAKSKELDQNQNNSFMAVAAQELQDAFDRAAQAHADYLGLPAPECQVNRDFLSTAIEPAHLQMISDAETLGQIPSGTFSHALLKSGIPLDSEQLLSFLDSPIPTTETPTNDRQVEDSEPT